MHAMASLSPPVTGLKVELLYLVGGPTADMQRAVNRLPRMALQCRQRTHRAVGLFTSVS